MNRANHLNWLDAYAELGRFLSEKSHFDFIEFSLFINRKYISEIISRNPESCLKEILA